MLEFGVTGVAPERRSPEYLAKIVADEIGRERDGIERSRCRRAAVAHRALHWLHDRLVVGGNRLDCEAS
jgi:hypothetical protein